MINTWKINGAGNRIRTRGKMYRDTFVGMIRSTQPCPVTIIAGTDARRCNDLRIDQSWTYAVLLASLQRCACRCKWCGTERCNDTTIQEKEASFFAKTLIPGVGIRHPNLSLQPPEKIKK